MFGWKTVTGAIMMACGQIAGILMDNKELGDMITAAGTAMMGIGVGHKLDKLRK